MIVRNGVCVPQSSASVRDRVWSVVLKAIATEAIAPGTVLFEAVIADALVTSRTPVRAALEMLREDGRVAKLEGRGYIVLAPDGSAPRQRRRIDRTGFSALSHGSAVGRAPAAWSRLLDQMEAEIAMAAVHGPLRILEAEVSKLHGVSRTVVREALSRLDRGGLIYKDEQLHWRVTPLTIRRVRDLYELRRALEPVALRRAAERGGLAQTAADMRDRLVALGASRDPAAADVQAFERELHIDMLSLCCNPEIMKALRVAQVQVASNRDLFEAMAAWHPMIIAEHIEIANSLANGDVSGAERQLIAHLSDRKVEIIEDLLAKVATFETPLPSYLQRS
ncbi:hypothetical protein GCM10008179_08460 [Hansschlegelia plantiphila]|uniref:HTH gntR-type domain-containing protein n=1 Tax=Hansschlegelia plantiphila TaxID=374655 RepID=A0A9W6J0L3_9HYPH|nr:hypothetical protein GCM10008179_08460 [Hansschlegelia plantiphila]